MENISPPATPEVAHLHLAVFLHEDETISRPRRRRRHPNGVQLPPPRTSTDEDEDNDICPVAGQQFVEYFTTRRANKGARWCIFLCWEESHGNFVKTVDVPLTADEREDEKKVFERIRLTFDQRRGFIRRWLYESIPEQAKIHPLGAPNLGDYSFTSLLQRLDPNERRSDILNEIARINDSLPGNQFSCYAVDSKPGHFVHLEDCLAHVGEDCPYQKLDSLERQLFDVESVPFILARLFSDPQLAAGQDILGRAMDSSLYNTYFYLYE
ncbi:hypothetical protein N7527_011830 [Penicillium freii]|nr:hypothetical protein N7527_011830 [Penicillium freii]